MTHETIDSSLGERVETVRTLLRPDQIRNHRVAEGLHLTSEQATDLIAKSALVSEFAEGMAAVSQAALGAPSGDRLMRTVRALLGTEPLHQAHVRGEIARPELPAPRLAKADLVLTADGFKIVEIEPGKIRGLGYGRMVRAQAKQPIGVGSEAAMAEITSGKPTALVLSETDKFHVPEMRLLGGFVSNLVVAPQQDFLQSNGGVEKRSSRQLVDQAIMMSPLHNGHGITEQRLREAATIVSDRRPDLESKGALALLHNAGGLPELEELLLRHFAPSTLRALRDAIPLSVHVALLDDQGKASLRAAVQARDLPVFLKPLADSGTRGIVTPDQHEQIGVILASNKLSKGVVIQEAHPSVTLSMQSADVMTGTEHEDEMSLRITVHTDNRGNIVEASVVGSPHEHLAHGGKTSVITNIELPQ